jgi:hypothetical protein
MVIDTDTEAMDLWKVLPTQSPFCLPQSTFVILCALNVLSLLISLPRLTMTATRTRIVNTMSMSLRIDLNITLKPIITVRFPQISRLTRIYALHRAMGVSMCLETIVAICFT